MKKIVIICILFIGSISVSNAQVNFGIKGGVNYNSTSLDDVTTSVLAGAKDKTGYHAGIWLRFKIPVIGLYIRPELVYTKLETEMTYIPGGNTTLSKAATYDFQKIDIPVLLGKKIFSVGNIFIGPSFQYVLSSDFDISDLEEIKSEGFSVGMQAGVGVEFGKIGIDVRWEKSLSDSAAKYVEENANNLSIDNRTNQIIVGVSYKF